MTIRQERSSDYPAVYQLVKTSFATASHSDGSEADYLNELRRKDTFIPELSLVAEMDGKLIGQIVLYKTDITTPGKTITELVLSPICVHPDYFRRGIARAMVEKALRIAGSMDYTAVFLCGEPEIYRRLGFAPSHAFGIYHVTDQEKNAANDQGVAWCMARELIPGALRGINGTINIE